MAVGVSYVHAESEIERLQNEINQRNARLTAIEKEIAGYETSLKQVGAEKNTLQSAINKLTLERKKVLADISYTENKIDNTDLEINKLILEINKTSESIDENRDTIRQIIRSLNASDDNALIEILLNHESLAEFWDEIESLETVRSTIDTRIDNLDALKATLEEKKAAETGKRDELSSLAKRYTDQQEVLESNTAEKDRLLKETKNEEKGYQAILAEKKASREQLIKEVQDIESQLQFILDPNTIPQKGSGVFRWPLDRNIITQYFGYTKFALANPSVYKNNMHNGMDLGTAVGTAIHAPLTGVVRNTGNTDLVPGCYSWGKWILLDHPNGLSTLYAHLSAISVVPGQKVATSEVIGYTGNTGYSTGPHLHFTVYVKDAVQVKQFNQFKASTGCGAALSPFSAIEGYLDPLDFLSPL